MPIGLLVQKGFLGFRGSKQHARCRFTRQDASFYKRSHKTPCFRLHILLCVFLHFRCYLIHCRLNPSRTMQFLRSSSFTGQADTDCNTRRPSAELCPREMGMTTFPRDTPTFHWRDLVCRQTLPGSPTHCNLLFDHGDMTVFANHYRLWLRVYV